MRVLNTFGGWMFVVIVLSCGVLHAQKRMTDGGIGGAEMKSTTIEPRTTNNEPQVATHVVEEITCRHLTWTKPELDGADGRALVGVGFGGSTMVPDVPWFLLPSNYSPYVLPNSGPTGVDSPYTNPFPFTNQSANNPPLLGNPGYGIHANITRHWPQGNASYVVVVPSGLPAAPPPPDVEEGGGGGGEGTTPDPDLSISITSWFGINATPGSIAAQYSWQNWVDAVRRTFDKYALVETAQTQATFLGVVRGAYGITDGAAPMALGTFIWSVANGGPTGNYANEIILTDQNIAGIGLTSMLVDPSTGEILECDVIINVGPTAAAPALTPGVIRQITTVIPNFWTTAENWTALDHEIGHFWGLDHTNLYAGWNAVLNPNTTGIPAGGYVATPPPGSVTRSRFPMTPNLVPNFPPATPISLPFPAMAGFITYIGRTPSQIAHSSFFEIHSDDAVGLSKIYPVSMPRPMNPKVPLINRTASIRGRYTNANLVTPDGVFARNILAIPEPDLDNATTGYARLGVLSSTARITDDALSTMAYPGISPTRNIYFDNLIQRDFFTPGSSAVGGPGSGDFSIDGLPATNLLVNNAPTGDPIEYDIVFEDSFALGVRDGGGTFPLGQNQAEWFNQGTFYVGNSFTPPFPMMSTNFRPAMTSLDNDVRATPVPAASSLSVVPGSVIYLTPDATNDGNLNIPAPSPLSLPSTVSSGPGSPAPRFRERTSRPIVSIEPRTIRYPITQNVTITVCCDEPNSAYDITTARLFVNGTNVAIPASATVVTLPAGALVGGGIVLGGTGGGRVTTTWTMTVASLINSVSPPVSAATPLRISFLISAAPQPGNLTLFDLGGPAQNVTVVSGIGRNDVIL